MLARPVRSAKTAVVRAAAPDLLKSGCERVDGDLVSLAAPRVLERVRVLLPANIRDGEPEQVRQATILVLFSFALAMWGPIEGSVFWAAGLPLGALACAVGIGTILASIVILRWTGSVRIAGHWLAAQMYFIVLFCSLEVGGLSSSAVAWDAAVPVFATMVAGRRAGVVWLGLVVVQLLGLGAAAHWGVLPQSLLTDATRSIYDFVVMAGAAALMTSLAWLYENEKNIALRAVEVEAGRVREAHAQSQRILDNIPAGLAMVDVGGVLQSVRSAISDRWFGPPTSGAHLWEWLGGREDFCTALELGWDQLAGGMLPADVALDQLPVELRHADSTYRVGYHPLMRGDELDRVLVTISDVSAELAAARSRVVHDDMMALVTRFGRDPHGCREFIAETQASIAALQETQDLIVVRRIVHTLKGNSATFGMRGFARRLHDCEDQLAEGLPSTLIDTTVAGYWSAIGPVVQPLVGDPEMVDISRATLRRWTEALARKDYAAVRRELSSRLTEPTGPRLERFAVAAGELARRLDKEPPHVSISDGGVRVDPQQWAPTWAGLTHLVRNCVDHGIEAANDRVAAGKPAAGQMALTTYSIDDAVVVEVRDDGRGIDWDRVRSAAATKGLPTATHEDLVDALFADGLSTRETVTATSGRGVGMASIKSTLEALGGRIEVETGVGSGTLFRCVVPDGHGGAPRSMTA